MMEIVQHDIDVNSTFINNKRKSGDGHKENDAGERCSAEKFSAINDKLKLIMPRAAVTFPANFAHGSIFDMLTVIVMLC